MEKSVWKHQFGKIIHMNTHMNTHCDWQPSRLICLVLFTHEALVLIVPVTHKAVSQHQWRTHTYHTAYTGLSLLSEESLTWASLPWLLFILYTIHHVLSISPEHVPMWPGTDGLTQSPCPEAVCSPDEVQMPFFYSPNMHECIELTEIYTKKKNP